MWIVWSLVGCVEQGQTPVAEPVRSIDAGQPDLPSVLPEEPACGPTAEGYVDADGDGFGVGRPVRGCTGLADHGGDCDDTSSDVHPGAPELCDDGRDDDCDPTTVESGATTDGQRYTTLADALRATNSRVIGLCPGVFAGPVRIDRALTLRGAGVGQTVIDAGGTGPGIEVRGGGALVLSGVTVTGGRTPELGGGIAVNANAVARIEDVEIVGNEAATGGGLYVGGSAEVLRTTIADNLATGEAAPAGVFVAGEARLVLEDGIVRGNAGAGMWVDGGIVDLTGGVFDDHDGSGVVIGARGDLVSTGSTFSGNGPYGLEIAADAGPVDLAEATFTDNVHDLRLPDGAVLDGVGAAFTIVCDEGACDP